MTRARQGMFYVLLQWLERLLDFIFVHILVCFVCSVFTAHFSHRIKIYVRLSSRPSNG